MAFIVSKVTLVLSRAIKPLELTFAVLLVVEPASSILNATRPREDTVSIDLVVSELAVVETAIGTIEHPTAVLFTLFEQATV